MLKETPDHYDAELVIRLYELRREQVMREARDLITNEFWPRNAAEAVAVTAPGHPLNRAYRQVSTYWEMVFGMARHGVIHGDFLAENSAEGLYLYARVEPYVEEIRAATTPRSFRSAQWVVEHVPMGGVIMEQQRARVQKKLEGR